MKGEEPCVVSESHRQNINIARYVIRCECVLFYVTTLLIYMSLPSYSEISDFLIAIFLKAAFNDGKVSLLPRYRLVPDAYKLIKRIECEANLPCVTEVVPINNALMRHSIHLA
jgi:hypothetical protein